MTRSRLKACCMILAVTAILVAAQQGLHSFRHDVSNEFSQNEDEPNHFVTGLMIRDYLVHHSPLNPVRFARSYYLHYPKVAFGSWPPLWHIGLGLFMVVLPPSRESANLYLDILTALLAVSSFIISRRVLPPMAALAVGLAVWISPLTQRMDQTIGADIQYSLFAMLCVYIFASYIDAPSGSLAFWFGLTLFGAVMTKNNALFLGISVPLVVLFTRSFRVLRRWDLWAAIVPNVVIVGLWQYLTLPFNVNNMAGRNAETAVSVLFVENFRELAFLPWIGLLPLVLWGVYQRVAVPFFQRKPVLSADAASLALMLGAPLFHAMLPHGPHPRYLMAALAPMLIFCVEGVLDLFSRFAAVPAKVALASCLIVAPALAQPVPPLPHSGYGQVAAEVIQDFPTATEPAVLISAGFDGEAALVAELTVRDQRPGRWILRATKILRHKVGAFNRETEVVSTPPEEMLHYFQELPIGMVILVEDGDPFTTSSRDYLSTMIERYADQFHLVSATPVGSTCEDAPCQIKLYQFTGAAANTRFSPEKLPQNMPLWQIRD